MGEQILYLFTGTIFIPFGYVCLINAFYDHRQSRDYLPNICRRFLSASLFNVFAVSTTYYLLGLNHSDPLKQMGFRADGFLSAMALPTFLTAIFYTGTLATLAIEWSSLSNILTAFHLWRKSLKNLLWVRQAIMAPTTEEIAFRACSASLLKHCLGEVATTFLAPISFSLSHIHHIFEDRRSGKSLNEALMHRAFQMLYTYLFGIYATHIFIRTGHIIAPILCHSLCNLLEIPSIGELPVNVPESRAIHILLYTLHIAGFLGWFLLRPSLLCPQFYQ